MSGQVTETAAIDRTAIEEATPATRAVYEVCTERDAPTQSEIVEATGLSRASVRAAAKELAARDLLEVRPDPLDARRRRYELLV